jgi:cell wall-associated NlpC family hydrolase
MTPVAAARTYLGVPFRHQGRNRYGLDCAGLVIAAYADAGVVLHDLPAYGREPWKDGLRAAVETSFKPAPDDDMIAGDVLLFRVRREPQHVAMVTGANSMIHCYATVGKVVEHSIGDRWRGQLVGHYRL